MELQEYLGKFVEVIIDRPLGSKHPNFDIIYELNYGYIPNTISGDGEEIDVYVLDIDEPIERCNVKIIGLINRFNDNENKLVGVCNSNLNYSDLQIMSKVNFIEKWFKSTLIR